MHSGREERRRFITVSHRERFILHLYLLTLQNNLFYPLFLERHLLNISVTSQRNVAFSPRVGDSKLIAIFFSTCNRRRCQNLRDKYMLGSTDCKRAVLKTVTGPADTRRNQFRASFQRQFARRRASNTRRGQKRTSRREREREKEACRRPVTRDSV